MALFIRQNEERSELQQRVAAELQEKARQKAEHNSRPDGITDSQYLKDTKSTTSLAWVWVVVTLLAVAVFVFIIVSGNQ